MGKHKGSDNTPYIDYYLSFHEGFCIGPVDSIEEVWMKDKLLIRESITGNTVKFIDKPELFGGNQREGGAIGNIHFMLGEWDQKVPESLAARLEDGATPDDVPGFRGIASLFFVGKDDNGGFKVSSNYPNAPGTYARVVDNSWTLSGGNAYAIITSEFPSEEENDEGEQELITYYNSGPAHIIHEAMVDQIWGMGGHPALIDNESFLYAAETLFNEGFGLSFLWVRSSTVEAFIQEVLDHINALLFFNPRNGLATIKLLRADYDPEECRIVNPSNSKLLTFRRKLWGETVNEIVVSWTNPTTEESESITYQSLGNIAMQGEVVTEPRNYYGVRSPELAAELAARDIVSAAYPLASATIEVDRKLWDVLPGEVLRFEWPVEGYDIGSILMRVMDIDYDKPLDSKMRLELLEDVFALDTAEFIQPPETEWKPPGHNPNGPKYAPPLPAKFVAAPYPIIQGISYAYEPTDDDYPIIVVAAFVTPNEDMTDLMSFNMWRQRPDALGDMTWSNLGEKGLAGKGRIVNGLTQEARSTVEFRELKGNLGPEIEGFVIIGDETEYFSELAMISDYDGIGTFTIERGVLDTTPKDWPPGTDVWFFTGDFYAFDWYEPLADETLEYRLQARTSLGVRDFESVASHFTAHPARHYFPFRPANVKIDSVAFGGIDLSENHDPREWSHEVTWANRHRMTEDVIVRRWDEGPTSPEEDQFTEVHVNGNPYATGLTGNAYTIDVFETGRMLGMAVGVPSRRHEWLSLQNHIIDLRLYDKGYGSDWGYFWGGWPAADFNEHEALSFEVDEEVENWIGDRATIVAGVGEAIITNDPSVPEGENYIGRIIREGLNIDGNQAHWVRLEFGPARNATLAFSTVDRDDFSVSIGAPFNPSSGTVDFNMTEVGDWLDSPITGIRLSIGSYNQVTNLARVVFGQKL